MYFNLSTENKELITIIIIAIRILFCVPVQIKDSNISIFLPIFQLTVSFTDPLWFAMYHNRCSYKRSNDKLGPSLLYILIDLTIVSSIGNRTSTCLMYNSSHDKIIVVLTFAFKCRLVNEITLMQPGMQANQLASTINCAGNITNFTENHASKGFFFFSRLKRHMSSNFCVS